jgi:hypothetical protein
LLTFFSFFLFFCSFFSSSSSFFFSSKGTRHPSTLIGGHRFYAGSCIWTFFNIIQSFAVLGRLRTITDRATLLYTFIDSAFGTLSFTSEFFILKYFDTNVSIQAKERHANGAL